MKAVVFLLLNNNVIQALLVLHLVNLRSFLSIEDT
jgi:hypothetical protein